MTIDLPPEDTRERVDIRLRRSFQSGRHPRQLMICGPAGTGKTYGILAALHCLTADIPNLRGLFLRQTRAALTESVQVTYEQKILPRDGMEHLASGAQRGHRHSYKYPNKSEIVLAGLDKDLGRVMSTEWDWVYVNETIDLKEAAWESIGLRLGRPGRDRRFGWLIGDTNPSYPSHWLKQRCDRGATRLWTTLHEANPANYDANGWTPEGLTYLTEVLDKLTGHRKLRFRYGIWAAAEGAVYDTWTETHVVRPFTIPRTWRRIRSIDFGYVDPFVCQWWAISPTGRMVLYREVYGCGRTVARWAQIIKGLTGKEEIEVTVADHDREDRETLFECGIATVPAYKAIKPGIELVHGRITREANGDERGLWIVEDCRVERDMGLATLGRPTSTLEEIPGYAWAPMSEKRASKEVPVDKDNHGCDAARYAVAYVDGLGMIEADVW